VCSPTRFALITGRYQYRIPAAAEEPLSSRAHGVEGMGLDPTHPTLPSQLRDAGYATGLVGKWHLGYPPHFHPLKSGYQKFDGSLSGGLDYFAHTGPTGTHDLWHGEEEAFSDEYYTDFVSRKAVEFVDAQSRDRPFMLSVHYTAPHWPWETRDDRAESQRISGAIRHLDGGSIATYRRMIHHMDEGIGRILAALAARGMATTAASAFPTSGPSSAARWICSRAASACR
jgi:arylsulfatase A-like enzyme